MSILLLPVGSDGQAFNDANGAPRSGAQLFVYLANTSTKATLYQDAGGAANHANPIILNSAGQVANGSSVVKPIFADSGSTYDVVLAPSNDTDPPASPYFPLEDISLVNDGAVSSVTEWIEGTTPTYVSATQLTLVGNQTSTYTVGRRIKTENTGGTIYSTVTVSAYTSLTTITVVNDSGTLDSGLSAVYYGLLSTNSSIPGVELSGDNWTHQGTVKGENSVYWAKGADIASATSITLGTDGNYFDITGSTGPIGTITVPAGMLFMLQFDSTPTLTHHATNLNLPGGADITATAGDRLIGFATAANTVHVISYIKASGKPVVGITTRAAQATTSGTSKDFTSIPAGVKRISVMLLDVSSDGASDLFHIQLGDSGGLETTNYLSSSARLVDSETENHVTNATAGFLINQNSSGSHSISGKYTLELQDALTNTWVGNGGFRYGSGLLFMCAGSKALSGTLTQVSLVVTGGGSFDAGSVSISYD